MGSFLFGFDLILNLCTVVTLLCVHPWGVKVLVLAEGQPLVGGGGGGEGGDSNSCLRIDTGDMG